MKKLAYSIFLLGFFFLFFDLGLVFGTDSGKTQYEKALKFIREKQVDYALMEFRSIIRSFPGTQCGRDSMFAMGEYFYTKKMYYEAAKNFSDYLKAYSDSGAAVFARAYLLKIVQKIEEQDYKDEYIEDLEMDFFSEPLFLLFSEYKEVSYKSAFQNDFSVRYYIDTVEIYRNGELFLKISE